MKKLLLMIGLVMLMFPFALKAQVYQLPNGGFETWDGTSSSSEPTNWNSFGTSECTLFIGCSSAQQTHHENSSDVRPGSAGSHSCRIYATSIMGVVANGNMTTGRIHAGNMSPANSANYNVTYPNQAGFNQPFNGRPDYIHFWAKAQLSSSSDQARMNTVVHNNSEVRDPIRTSDHVNITGVATLNFSGDNTWHEYSVPFSYSYGNATPEYILITFTTNKTPGGGTSGDAVYIDDIDFVYISTLSDLKSNGQTVAGFDANTLTYNIELPYGSAMPTVTATATSVNGVVSITQPTVSNPTATIVVTQGPSTTTYTINYTFAERESADLLDVLLDGNSINGYNVTPAFDANIMQYEVSLPFGAELPVVSAVLDVPTAQLNITQPTSTNPVATLAVTCGSLSKTYTVHFTIAEAISADLADLQLDGVTISGFSPQVLQYSQVLPYGHSFPTITATPVNDAAQVNITEPTLAEPVATIVVTCDTLTKTYTVEFVIAEAEDAHLSQITVNGELIAGFQPLVFDYNYELPFGTNLSAVQVGASTVSSQAVIAPIIVDTLTEISVTCGSLSCLYTIHFTIAPEITADLADLQVDGVTVTGFDPAVTTYQELYFGTEMPVVTATPRSAIGEVTITQPDMENPTATVVVICSGLSKTYTVNITLVEPNADLADLQVDGATVEGFSPDVTEYVLTYVDMMNIPVVTATPVSEYATVEVIQPDWTNINPEVSVVVSCGSLTKTYTLDFHVGVREYNARPVMVYPNPVADELTVEAPAGASEVHIYNPAGQLVLRQSVQEGSNVLNVSSLRKGFYLLHLRGEGVLMGTSKLMKY